VAMAAAHFAFVAGGRNESNTSNKRFITSGSSVVTCHQIRTPEGLTRRSQHTLGFVRDDITRDALDGVSSTACLYKTRNYFD